MFPVLFIAEIHGFYESFTIDVNSFPFTAHLNPHFPKLVASSYWFATKLSDCDHSVMDKLISVVGKVE
jgi:hypothetical protein